VFCLVPIGCYAVFSARKVFLGSHF